MRRLVPGIGAAALLASVVALGGCFDDGEATAPLRLEQGPEWSPYALAEKPDYPFHLAFDVVHAHDVRALHTNSYGLDLVGFSSLQDGLSPLTLNGAFIEVDVHGDLVAVATLTGTHAFTLVDISDLSRPTAIGHLYSSNDNWDVRFSDDGRYLFVSCQGEGLFTRTPVGQCPDYGGIPTAVGGQDYGIITVDVSDPHAIEPICYTPSLAVHNLETATLDDGRIVVANNNAEVFVMEDDGCLTKVAQVEGRHDVYLQKHPFTRDMLLYTGTSDFVIYDINDPSQPFEIGVGDFTDYEDGTAWHEQSPAPVAYFGNTHVTLGGGESSSGRPGPVTIFNTTDPTRPVAVGSWTLPVLPLDEAGTTWEQGGYMFSMHNIALNQWGQACIAMYHAGVWVIDLSTPERMHQPVTLGFYLPHELAPEALSTSHPIAGPMTASPYVWGCAWTEDGTHLVVPDMQSGLYVLKGTWFAPRVDA